MTTARLTFLLMVSLLEFVPLVMKVLALGVLVAKRPGRHAGVVALLAFTGASDGVLRVWPGAWSVGGYVLEHTIASLCVAIAAIDSVRRLPDRRLVFFRMACVAGSAWFGGLVLAHLFPPDTVRTTMVRVHFAAASVAGIAAGTRRLDPVDDAALRWLFVTRVLLCMRLPLIGTPAHAMLSGATTVAWAVACYLIVHHCLSSPASGEGAPAPEPRRDPRRA